MTSKQRAYLRSLASQMDTIFQVGKGGISEEMCKQISNALDARELIKLRVLDNAEYLPREAAEEIAEAIGAEVVTTFDLRVTRPNFEPVMDNPAIHAFEHLAATFLRNHDEWKDRVIYFGPMGCRTGFYLLLAGDLTSEDIFDLMTEMFAFVADFEGEIPGASAKDCGNYLDMNLSMAKFYARKFQQEVLNEKQAERLVYPE